MKTAMFVMSVIAKKLNEILIFGASISHNAAGASRAMQNSHDGAGIKKQKYGFV